MANVPFRNARRTEKCQRTWGEALEEYLSCITRKAGVLQGCPQILGLGLYSIYLVRLLHFFKQPISHPICPAFRLSFFRTLCNPRHSFKMDVEGDLIWGDDDESELFAQIQSQDVSIIFRYSLNPKLPRSLPSRIVTCFHDLPAEACETFPNRA